MNGFRILLIIFVFFFFFLFCFDRCGDGDHLALYLHLDRGEINEKTPSNGRLCSLPAKRSGRYGGQAVRYYSAKSSLVLAFHTNKNAPTGNHPSSNHQHGDSASFSTPSVTSNSTNVPYGFKGTYRFIRKSNEQNLVAFLVFFLLVLN